MDNETIIKLVNAGYTKEEIAKMEAGDVGAGDGAGAGDGEGENKPTENKPAENTPAGAEHQSEIDKTLKALTDSVAGLTATVKAMQSANVKGAATGSPSGTDTLKDTIDSFIKTL